MSKEKRFFFDDDEYDDVPAQPSKKTNDIEKTKEIKVTPIIEESKKAVPLKEEKIQPKEEAVKNTKQKKKFRFRLWHGVVLFFVIAVAAFTTWIYIASSNDGPIYGDRCASALAIDSAHISGTTEAIKTMVEVQDAVVEIECTKIKISITFVDNTTSAKAQEIAAIAVGLLDNTVGRPKVDGSNYSDLLTNVEGGNAYDVEIIMRSNGDSDFPIFAQKHPSSDSIYYTGANPANQATTDEIIANEAEKDAEQQAQEETPTE